MSRDERLTAAHRQLADQVAALRGSKEWRAWLDTAARFRRYSLNNTLLIHAQRPDATRVAGYRDWQRLGRQVAKGEKGIAILAPVVRRARKDDEPDGEPPRDDDPPEPRLARFRITYVWDISQTTGEPLPEQPKPQLLAGQAPLGLWDALAGAVRAQGYRIERGDCDGANGFTDVRQRLVRVRDDVDEAQAVKTLVHELAHIRLHAGASDGAPAGGTTASCRGTSEVEAESVAYLVAAAHGMDASGYTFTYVAGWAEAAERAEAAQDGGAQPDVVQATAGRVLDAANWVLTRVETQLARATAPAPAVEAVPAVDARRERLLAMHREAAAFYTRMLPGSWVPEYLESRGLAAALSPAWDAGYAPDRWTALVDHLRGRGHTDQDLLDSGLAVRARTGRLIDRFRDRLVLPVRDLDGAVVAFVGRAAPDADPDRVPKYLNSPGTSLYTKGDHLFGRAQAAPALERRALPVLVEGPMDAIAVTVATEGRCAGLAMCGTLLTLRQGDQLLELARHSGEPPLVVTDPDLAGWESAALGLEMLARRGGVDPGTCVLPHGKDPADVLREHGPGELTWRLLHDSRNLADHVIARRLVQWRPKLRWAEGRVGAVRDVVPIIAALPVEAAMRQADRVALLVGVDRWLVHQEVINWLGHDPPGWPPSARTAAEPPSRTAPPPPRVSTPPAHPTARRR